jgi:putative cardiolipin synthase
MRTAMKIPALHSYATLPVFLSLLLAGCASLPDHTQREESYAIAKAGTSELAQKIRTARENHPGKSGFHLLKGGVDALLARLTLAEKAEFSLDVQYYIWHPDLAGAVFAQAMLNAADRGVRVRILLDDIGARANDQTLLALDSHPNIEVRLFNPVASRSFRYLNMLLDFSRINRRMHNKAFIADNQAAIVGGRNIGDEYFDAPGAVVFGDLDVLTVGKVVPEISLSFDRFWNAPQSLPISILVTDKPDDAGHAPLARLQTDLSAYLNTQRNNPYITQAQTQFELALAQGDVPLEWGDAQLLYDVPDKIEQIPEQTTGHLLHQLSAVGPKIKDELLIVSPYFIPGKAGLAWLQGLSARGVKVTVLTNSLAATDVAAVHAGYQQYRRALLEAGVQLYELKPDISHHPHAPKSMISKLLANSRASLHAKVFALDRSAIFIGSLNLDPRSVLLNTEIGVLCSSKELSEDVVSGLEKSIADIAWKVEQRKQENGNSHLVWVEQGSAGTLEINAEPQVGSWRKLSVWLLQWLPIESQL